MLFVVKAEVIAYKGAVKLENNTVTLVARIRVSLRGTDIYSTLQIMIRYRSSLLLKRSFNTCLSPWILLSPFIAMAVNPKT